MALKGRHLLPQEGGDDMAGHDALIVQLPDVLHGGGKLAITRIGFLPLSLADQ
jgi:hypothetical protein